MTTNSREKTDQANPTTEKSLFASASTREPAGIIPVGEEPRRRPVQQTQHEEGCTLLRKSGSSRTGEQAGCTPNAASRGRVQNRPGLTQFKKAMQDIRAFRRETMRHLRRAEICVWQAIHECQGIDGAQVSQETLMEFTGIKSRRHVGEAIEDLADKGLLEVLVQGRYRPNGKGDYGLSSIYRVYPRPELRLARLPLTTKQPKKDKKRAAGDENTRPIVRSEKPK